MASDESIKKMVHAILEKRKELGFPDWGQVPIEDVLHRLNQPNENQANESPSENNLANQQPEKHNNYSENSDSKKKDENDPPPLL